jgi:hypothetical protein
MDSRGPFQVKLECFRTLKHLYLQQTGLGILFRQNLVLCHHYVSVGCICDLYIQTAAARSQYRADIECVLVKNILPVSLDLGYNALRGSIPISVASLPNLGK